MRQKGKSICLLLGLALATSTAMAKCEPLTGQEIVKDAQTILLGELHGTNEMPAFAANLVCHLLEQGRSVTVAVELPTNWTPAMREAATQRQGLKANGWNEYWKDGRTSAAMLRLLENVSAMKQKGAAVEPFGFDMAKHDPNADRDKLMAENLLKAIKQRPKDVLLVLTGNLHARAKRDTHPFVKVPMAVWLAESTPERRQVSLLGHYNSGSAWICSSATECGAQQFGTEQTSDKSGIAGLKDAALQAIGYDAAFYLGTITASPPAVL
jgi:erythromycin esterase-like protein